MDEQTLAAYRNTLLSKIRKQPNLAAGLATLTPDEKRIYDTYFKNDKDFLLGSSASPGAVTPRTSTEEDKGGSTLGGMNSPIVQAVKSGISKVGDALGNAAGFGNAGTALVNADNNLRDKSNEYFNEKYGLNDEGQTLTAGVNTGGNNNAGNNSGNSPDSNVGQPSNPASAPEVSYETPNVAPRQYSTNIWDAWRNGQFGEGDDAKSRRNYYLMDAISKGAHNLGQDFGKIAAAYGGGQYNPEYQQSQWEARNEALNNTATSAEANRIVGSDAYLNATAKNLSNSFKGNALEAAKILQNAIYDKNGNLRPEFNVNTVAGRENYNRLMKQANAIGSGGGDEADWKTALTRLAESFIGKTGLL